jgi:hypothetical protein
LEGVRDGRWYICFHVKNQSLEIWVVYIHTKIKILEGLGMKLLEYLMAIWNILAYIYLTFNFEVYIVVIWYIFPILVY